MPIMPYIAILGILFLRDIIVDITEHYPLQTIIVLQQRDLMIQFKTTVDLQIKYKIHSGRNVVAVHLFHRQRLTSGGSPSYRRHPAVHLPGTGSPLHSLAI